MLLFQRDISGCFNKQNRSVLSLIFKRVMQFVVNMIMQDRLLFLIGNQDEKGH